jgi:hypothetical protein
MVYHTFAQRWKRLGWVRIALCTMVKTLRIGQDCTHLCTGLSGLHFHTMVEILRMGQDYTHLRLDSTQGTFTQGWKYIGWVKLTSQLDALSSIPCTFAQRWKCLGCVRIAITFHYTQFIASLTEGETPQDWSGLYDDHEYLYTRLHKAEHA